MIRDKIVVQLKKTISQKSFKPEVFAPENEKFGHYSTNAALRIARLKKENPLKVAEQIYSQLMTRNLQLFEKIEIAPPGFINFWISKDALDDELQSIIKLNEGYGKLDTLQNKKVMVEFTDPNPFKEFHIGHLYSNIVGESISRILEASGANVKRANYQGDVGLHVAKALWGMMERMKKEKMTLAQLGRKTLAYRIKYMGQAYAKGARAFDEDETAKLEIIDLNKKIFALDREIKNLYGKGRRWSLEYFETLYRKLGTKFDFYYFEREVGRIGLELVKKYLKKGVFEVSQDAIVFPGEKYGLHRRVFVNSEGLPTYEAKELGLAQRKYEDFKYDISIIVTGSEVIDYFKVLLCALHQINPQLAEKAKHITHGMVRFSSGKMSSRTGNVVTAEALLDETKKRVLKIIQSSRNKIPKNKQAELVEQIAVGSVKYSLLKGSLGQDVVFDFDKSLTLTGDSGPYLQYTYARLKSVMRKAHGLPKKPDFLLLGSDAEKSIIRQLIYFPDALERATALFETNIMTDYLFKLANALNYFYEKEPILKAEKPLRDNRLNLIHVATIVLEKGLRLLGIEAIEAM